MIRIEPLKAWHLEVLHSEGYIPEGVYFEGYSVHLVSTSFAVAVICNERVIGAGGITPLWGSVAEGWSFITEHLRARPLLMVKAFKAFFNKCPEYKRVQITVEKGFEKAEAFAEYLGFTPEGVMRYYGPNGETHTRYARIK